MLTEEQASRVAKLPTWLRNYINKLEWDNAYYLKQLQQIEGTEETNTFIKHFGIGEDRPLPADTAILFRLSPTREGIICRINEGKLEVRGEYTTIKIRPIASNSILVDTSK